MFDVIDSISCRMWLETMTLLPCAAPLLDQADGLAARERIHAGQRLVEDQQLGIVRERLRQLDALPHALAVGADLLVGGVDQVDQLERPLAPPSRGLALVDAVQPHERGHPFEPGHPLVERVLLRAEADAEVERRDCRQIGSPSTRDRALARLAAAR